MRVSTRSLRFRDVILPAESLSLVNATMDAPCVEAPMAYEGRNDAVVWRDWDASGGHVCSLCKCCGDSCACDEQGW